MIASTLPSGEPLLEIAGLHVETVSRRAPARPVLEDITLTIQAGEIVGLVGESGSGKSVLSLSAMGLLPAAMRISRGEIRYGPHVLSRLKHEELRRLRGKEVSMIFQDPMTSLNPALTVGEQVAETVREHLGCGRKQARRLAVDMLESVGLPRPELLFGEYPHQLSGGMRQRVMIAIALSCRPRLLIADEPTTALDATIQAQILELLRRLSRELGTAVLLISHDLGVVADMCHRIAVLYAGQIMEEGPTRAVLEAPRHPYTAGLLQSIPTPAHKGRPLDSIPGTVPGLDERGNGCRFSARCGHVRPVCLSATPAMVPVGDRHTVRCVLAITERGQTHAAG